MNYLATFQSFKRSNAHSLYGITKVLGKFNMLSWASLAFLKKGFWIAVYFIFIIPDGYSQFFTDTFIVDNSGTSISIQEVLIDDNVGYYYGTYNSEMTYEGFPLAHQGGTDAFLIKRVDEQVEWIFFGGSAGNDILANMVLDASGNIIIGGSFTNEAQFADLTLTSQGSSRAIFVITISPDGEILASHTVNGTAQKDLAGIAVVNNQIFLAGSFGATLFVDDTETVANSAQDIFLMKLDDELSPAWIQNYGIEGTNEAVDFSWSEIAEQFVVSGQFDQRIGVIGDTIQTNTFDEDIFLAAFDVEGQGKWISKLGGVFEDINEAHTLDTDGGIYLTGFYRGIIRFEDGSEIDTGNIGNSDSYLIKCDSEGNKVWARTLGNQGEEFGTGLLVEDGKIHWTGYHNQSYQVDGILFGEPDGTLAAAYAIFDAEQGLLEANLNLRNTAIVIPQGLVIDNESIFVYGDFNGESSFEQVYDAGQNFVGFATEINVASVSTVPLRPSTSISVYPNPSEGIFNFTVSELAQSIEIYTSVGQLVYKSDPVISDIAIDLTNLVDGVYFWRSSLGECGRLVKK